MNHLYRLALAAATATLLAGPAFAQQGATTSSTTGMSSTSGSMGHGPADQEFMQAMQTMQQKMSSARLTGNADRDFTTMMIPHHQSAVAMAKTELKYGKSAYLKRMARNIIKSQDREISEMHHWRAKHPHG